MKKPIIYAFIDSQNLNLAIRDQGWRLDFERFYIYLKDKYHVHKVFLFIGYIQSNELLYASLKKEVGNKKREGVSFGRNLRRALSS